MAVDDAGDEDGGEGDAVGDLADQGVGGGQGGRGDAGADVVVDYGADDDVGGDGAGLQEEEGFGEVAGVFELGDEVEEGSIAGCERRDGVLAGVRFEME